MASVLFQVVWEAQIKPHSNIPPDSLCYTTLLFGLDINAKKHLVTIVSYIKSNDF